MLPEHTWVHRRAGHSTVTPQLMLAGVITSAGGLSMLLGSLVHKSLPSRLGIEQLDPCPGLQCWYTSPTRTAVGRDGINALRDASHSSLPVASRQPDHDTLMCICSGLLQTCRCTISSFSPLRATLECSARVRSRSKYGAGQLRGSIRERAKSGQ